MLISLVLFSYLLSYYTQKNVPNSSLLQPLPNHSVNQFRAHLIIYDYHINIQILYNIKLDFNKIYLGFYGIINNFYLPYEGVPSQICFLFVFSTFVAHPSDIHTLLRYLLSNPIPHLKVLQLDYIFFFPRSFFSSADT
jgi:hypothetical protein